MRGRRSISGWLPVVVGLFGLGLAAASFLPLIDSDDWWIRIFDFPRAQVAAGLALAVVGAILLLPRCRATTWGLVLVLLAALGLQLHRIWPYTALHPVQAEAAASCAAGERLSVLVANLQASNRGAGPFLELVRRENPDIVFVAEVDARWAEALRPLEASHPHHLVHPRDDAWGLAFYSRLELVEPQVRHLLSDYVPSAHAGVRLPSGALLAFHGLHPKPPAPFRGTGERDAELLLAARAAREGGVAEIVAGDLNDVAWSRTTRLFQRVGGLIDPRIGRGLYATFPAELPPALRWPLDHIFFTEGFRLLALDRMPHVGSDHLPLMATLCHAPRPPGAPPVVPGPTEDDLERAEALIREGREDAREARGGD